MTGYLQGTRLLQSEVILLRLHLRPLIPTEEEELDVTAGLHAWHSCIICRLQNLDNHLVFDTSTSQFQISLPLQRKRKKKKTDSDSKSPGLVGLKVSHRQPTTMGLSNFIRLFYHLKSKDRRRKQRRKEGKNPLRVWLVDLATDLAQSRESRMLDRQQCKIKPLLMSVDSLFLWRQRRDRRHVFGSSTRLRYCSRSKPYICGRAVLVTHICLCASFNKKK